MPENTERKVALNAALPWLALGILLIGGMVFYLRLPYLGWTMGDWGSRGDALGPFAALLNAGALFALLRSLKLQREALGAQRTELSLQRDELKLQRQELKESRDVMKDQARAQAELVAAQKELAAAQRDAVGEARAMRQATFFASSTRVLGALLRLEIAKARSGTSLEDAGGIDPSREIDALEAKLNRLLQVSEGVQRALAEQEGEPDDEASSNVRKA